MQVSGIFLVLYIWFRENNVLLFRDKYFLEKSIVIKIWLLHIKGEIFAYSWYKNYRIQKCQFLKILIFFYLLNWSKEIYQIYYCPSLDFNHNYCKYLLFFWSKLIFLLTAKTWMWFRFCWTLIEVNLGSIFDANVFHELYGKNMISGPHDRPIKKDGSSIHHRIYGFCAKTFISFFKITCLVQSSMLLYSCTYFSDCKYIRIIKCNHS